MRSFRALVKKGLLDGRWTLGLSSLALFALSWLFVWSAMRFERAFAEAASSGRTPGGMRMLRGLGGASMDFSSAALELAFWNHPLVILTIGIWAIARGAHAVGGELERGSMDIILSRPISRSTYLASQIATAVLGLLILVGAMVAGNLLSAQFNAVKDPPGLLVLCKAALNLAAMGVIMFGYTLMFSSVDSVRWRPNLLGSVATLSGFILTLVVNLPTLEDWKWLEKFSIFKAYNPVEVVVTGESFVFNTSILSGLGAAFMVVAFVGFNRRDLPTPG